ncbi:MAG TPA: SRPBCC family protein [Pararhizobium sp.]|jgi:uncharacterized membrane protein|nr:SRPBCC family protein [Pararhizobium sp.]
MHHTKHSRTGDDALTLAALILGAAAAGAVVYFATDQISKQIRSKPHRKIDDAPRVAWRSGKAEGLREGTVVGRTVTINRPRDELYAFWRDFGNLDQFMENVRSVDRLDDKHSRWVVEGPARADVEFVAEIIEDKPNEMIAWKSEKDAPVKNSGRILFRDAPDGRGTEVEAEIAYDPPGGTIGQWAAKIMQREPNIQARRELKRFKQLMETGEVATAERKSSASRG